MSQPLEMMEEVSSSAVLMGAGGILDSASQEPAVSQSSQMSAHSSGGMEPVDGPVCDRISQTSQGFQACDRVVTQPSQGFQCPQSPQKSHDSIASHQSQHGSSHHRRHKRHGGVDLSGGSDARDNTKGSSDESDSGASHRSKRNRSRAGSVDSHRSKRARSRAGSVDSLDACLSREVSDDDEMPADGCPVHLQRDFKSVAMELRNRGRKRFDFPVEVFCDKCNLLGVTSEAVLTMDAFSKCYKTIAANDVSRWTQASEGYACVLCLVICVSCMWSNYLSAEYP